MPLARPHPPPGYLTPYCTSMVCVMQDAKVVFVILRRSLNQDRTTLKLLQQSAVVKSVLLGCCDVVFLFNQEVRRATVQHPYPPMTAQAMALMTAYHAAARLW